jgi:hypothetical protein
MRDFELASKQVGALARGVKLIFEDDLKTYAPPNLTLTLVILSAAKNPVRLRRESSRYPTGFFTSFRMTKAKHLVVTDVMKMQIILVLSQFLCVTKLWRCVLA